MEILHNEARGELFFRPDGAKDWRYLGTGTSALAETLRRCIEHGRMLAWPPESGSIDLNKLIAFLRALQREKKTKR
jgi:hypothetical protein